MDRDQFWTRMEEAVRAGRLEPAAKALRNLHPLDVANERQLRIRRGAILALGRLAEQRQRQIAEGHMLVEGDSAGQRQQLLLLVDEARRLGMPLLEAPAAQAQASIDQALGRDAADRGAVFISYRRADSQTIVSRLSEHLVSRFGAGAVFRDIDSIPIGSDYRSHLVAAVSRSSVCLVVIGPQWVDIRDSVGARRLDDPEDWVRIEIETALKLNRTLVVPLLVQETPMPKADQLPKSIVELSFREGQHLRDDPDFHGDFDRLIRRLRSRMWADD